MYGNSRQQVIPPTRSRVKAGFVVYSPESDTRELIILDEGELIAVDKSGGNRDIKFKILSYRRGEWILVYP